MRHPDRYLLFYLPTVAVTPQKMNGNLISSKMSMSICPQLAPKCHLELRLVLLSVWGKKEGKVDSSQAVAEEDTAHGSLRSGCEGTAIVALEPCVARACGALMLLLGCSTLSCLARCSTVGPVAEAPARSQAGRRSSPSTSRLSSPVGFG